jgi:F-type H+-transporting ATPase subunit a
VFLILTPLAPWKLINLLGISAFISGNLNIILTNISLNLVLIIITVISLHYYGNNDSKIIPNNWSIFLETSFASICSMVRSQIGIQSENLLKIYTYFINRSFILTTMPITVMMDSSNVTDTANATSTINTLGPNLTKVAAGIVTGVVL